MKRLASSSIILILLVSMFGLTFNIQPSKAEDNLLLEMEVSKTLITIGEEIDITLTVTNVGNTTVTKTLPQPPVFNVCYFTSEGFFSWTDGKVFPQVIVEITLEPGESYTETLHWDLYQFHYADGKFYPPRPGTYDLAGYCCLMDVDIWDLLEPEVYVEVTIVGDWWNLADVNFDFIVDIYDVVLAAGAYGSAPLDPNWNPHFDIAEPYGVIDIYDIVMICSSYGEEYLP
ncbi:MAG: BsuPI-related putative proteinase inhibitor [Candidatus Bathyarchaeota archaeon]|nr:BsuPI-related putative proteinase inhibitor [Candidatus Bathyarchaeota archaeon]